MEYEVSLDTPDRMGSGSIFTKIVHTRDEKEAFSLLYDGRNRLERTYKVNGKVVTEYFDLDSKKWVY